MHGHLVQGEQLKAELPFATWRTERGAHTSLCSLDRGTTAALPTPAMSSTPEPCARACWPSVSSRILQLYCFTPGQGQAGPQAGCSTVLPPTECSGSGPVPHKRPIALSLPLQLTALSRAGTQCSAGSQGGLTAGHVDIHHCVMIPRSSSGWQYAQAFLDRQDPRRAQCLHPCIWGDVCKLQAA